MSAVLDKSPDLNLNISTSFFIEELAMSNHGFSKIAQKVLKGERISVEDGFKLINSNEILLLGQLANFYRQKKAHEVAIRNGYDQKAAERRIKTVWWNTNVHLNPTNVCIGECDFCSFARKPNEEGAYTMSIPEALEKVKAARSEGATEVHIVGGLNPKTLIEYYSDLMQAIKSEVPGIHIKAFTAVEIEFFAKFFKQEYEARRSQSKAGFELPYEELSESQKFSLIFNELIKAGLDSMPGGGAEIFSRQVRDEMCPDKIPAETWVEIHQIAHSKGIRTNATMLAGIGEEAEERVEHLDVLRRAQDSSLSSGFAGFQTFIPLSCHYEGNDLLENGVKPLTGYDQLKNIAVSRLMLDNFDNIKAYWIQLGEKMAQIALSFGANDLDGTVKAERITNAAGAKKRGLAEETLTNIVEGARLIPEERDTVYNPIAESKHRI